MTDTPESTDDPALPARLRRSRAVATAVSLGALLGAASLLLFRDRSAGKRPR